LTFENFETGRGVMNGCVMGVRWECDEQPLPKILKNQLAAEFAIENDCKADFLTFLQIEVIHVCVCVCGCVVDVCVCVGVVLIAPAKISQQSARCRICCGK